MRNEINTQDLPQVGYVLLIIEHKLVPPSRAVGKLEVRLFKQIHIQFNNKYLLQTDNLLTREVA